MSTSSRSRLLRLIPAVYLLFPAGAGAQEANPVHYIHVEATDYAFRTQGTVEEGIATFHLVNKGTDVHQMTLLELGVGHTVKDFFDAMRATGEPPAWAVQLGSTPIIQPGHEAFLTLRLPPSRYILACLIPARDGRSHVSKGMYAQLTVTAAAAPAKKP
jgi:hypothetical protein